MTDKVTVPVESAWFSKINWTQASAAATALIVAFGVSIPPEKATAILAGLNVAQGTLTWIMRTWFTDSVTPGSVAGK